MLSLGTDCDFALAIASASVGLPVGSPPPVRAATSIVLISFAKSFPRLASTTAFLCLVVAHLEWPLMTLPSVPSLRTPSPGPAAAVGGPRPSRRTTGAHASRRSVPGGTRSRAASPAARLRPYRPRDRRRPCRAPRRPDRQPRPTARG